MLVGESIGLARIATLRSVQRAYERMFREEMQRTRVCLSARNVWIR